VPLFLQNPNCNCFDPKTTFVLNPAAWVNPPAGHYGTSAGYYSDYRYQRRPVENVSIGRIFPFREGRMSLRIRAEFTNIFNRVELNIRPVQMHLLRRRGVRRARRPPVSDTSIPAACSAPRVRVSWWLGFNSDRAWLRWPIDGEGMSPVAPRGGFDDKHFPMAVF
jgi:hypothetical protein